MTLRSAQPIISSREAGLAPWQWDLSSYRYEMTVPGGFPFGNEDLKDVLEGEVRGGGLGFGGGLYRIVKPGSG